MNRADRNRVQRALVTRPQGPGGDAPRGLAEWGGWLRQAGADVLGRVSLSELLDRLGRQVVRARRFRLQRGLRRRPTEVLEPRVLLTTPTIYVQNYPHAFAISLDYMGTNPKIGTADNPATNEVDDSLYYYDDDHQDPSKWIWTVNLIDTGTTGSFDLSTNTKALYFTGFDMDFNCDGKLISPINRQALRQPSQDAYTVTIGDSLVFFHIHLRSVDTNMLPGIRCKIHLMDL